MTYVPYVPTPPPPPSRRAKELAQRLSSVMREYERENPSLTAQEVRQATRLALRESSGSEVPEAVAVLAVTGVLVLGLGVAAFVARGGGLSLLGVAGALAVIAVVAVLIALARRAP